ncbi:acyltransferase family protein [Bacteroides graminisolvens]|uniref:acyltransferase family protein n=1 Tax=Bacteroides graminisolvens TaxID=477666 RepID=UPI002409C348|nr:acyltransferase [Bacteroides graminisolvens]
MKHICIPLFPNMTPQEVQSKTIAWLRFPMIIGVLLIHSYNPIHPKGEVFVFVRNLSSEVVARFCVPLFFLIAGYLFFYKLKQFNGATYREKLRKRASSLLVPYLFWNLWAIATYVVLQEVFELRTLAYGPVDRVETWQIADYLRCFWDIRAPHYPLVYPLWFVRDLMVTVLLTPLVYAGIKRLPHLFIAALFVAWIGGFSFRVTGLNTGAIFFFSIGALLSIQGRNMVTECRKIQRFSWVAYPAIALADTLCKGTVATTYLHPAGLLLGIVFTFNITSWFIEKEKIRPRHFLASGSFFVYAAHEQMLSQIRKTLVTFVPDTSETASFILYLLPLLLTVGITLALYYLQQRFVPALSRFTVGKRD